MKRIMQTFQCTQAEKDALDTLAARTGTDKSKLIRGLLFGQLDADNIEWIKKYADSKGVDTYTMVNIICRTFKKRCLTASYKKEFSNLILTGN